MVGILNIQLMPTLGKIEVNLRKVEHFIKQNSDKTLDLVVLPEYFSTGNQENGVLNAKTSELVIERVCELAKKYKTNIVAGTVIEQNDDKFYNTSFAINREGKIVAKYRKIHLFNYLGGNEGEVITAGKDFVVVDFDFGKVGLAICFDMRYPLQYRELSKSGAQFVVQPTAWCIPTDIFENPNSLKYAQSLWDAMNKTRAYDNSVYLVSSNQTGRISPDLGAIGHSMIVAPTSEILANAKNEQCAVFAEVDLEVSKFYKSLFPIE
jgi:predicted amidohydrolase